MYVLCVSVCVLCCYLFECPQGLIKYTNKNTTSNEKTNAAFSFSTCSHSLHNLFCSRMQEYKDWKSIRINSGDSENDTSKEEQQKNKQSTRITVITSVGKFSKFHFEYQSNWRIWHFHVQIVFVALFAAVFHWIRLFVLLFLFFFFSSLIFYC